MKEAYREVAQNRLNNVGRHGRHKTDPTLLAQRAHVRGKFASQINNEFFDNAYGEIIVDLFVAWSDTAPWDKDTREYLYTTAMALGSVKEKLIEIETYGKNAVLPEETKNE